MKKLLYLLPLLALMACEPNVVCRDKTFQDYTWVTDSCTSCGLNNFRFRDDDTMVYDFPSSGFYNFKSRYQFSEDCNSFEFNHSYPGPNGTDYTVTITKNTGAIIWMNFSPGNFTYYLHRQ